MDQRNYTPKGADYLSIKNLSLTTDIEKGIFITTGTFSKAARDEAVSPGKQQIDLIDGEELVQKLAEYNIGLYPVNSYEIDEEYFMSL